MKDSRLWDKRKGIPSCVRSSTFRWIAYHIEVIEWPKNIPRYLPEHTSALIPWLFTRTCIF